MQLLPIFNSIFDSVVVIVVDLAHNKGAQVIRSKNFLPEGLDVDLVVYFIVCFEMLCLPCKPLLFSLLDQLLLMRE